MGGFPSLSPYNVPRMRVHREAARDYDAYAESGRGPTVGKRTLTEGLVQRAPSERQPGGDAAPLLAAAATGSGSALGGEVVARMTSTTGADLAGVRAHTGAASQTAAAAIGARAYTVGQDIHFGAGEYQPGTAGGDRLIAHELVHTIQQGGGDGGSVQTKLEISQPGDAAEVEADSIAELALSSAGGSASPEQRPTGVVRQTVSRMTVQREGAADAGAGGGPVDAGGPVAGVPAPAGAAGGTCGTPEEQAKVDAFRLRTDMKLDRNIPSSGFGMFDATYMPVASLMTVTVKVFFKFEDSEAAPGFWSRIARTMAGEDLSRFYWSEPEKATFKAEFMARCMVDWSAKHIMESTKPCWDFTAVPLVIPKVLEDAAGAHYVMTVHKRKVAGTSFPSATGDPDLAHPENPATGDLDERDNQIDADYNSKSVAKSERERIEAALAAAACAPVLFAKDSDVIDPGPRARLETFAAALVAKQPTDPLIPIQLSGVASSEGDPAHNLDLSTRRGNAVRAVLTGAGAPQPIAATGLGPTGAPEDAANRRVDVAVDRVFETTYTGNQFAGSPHEFGHMLGLPDEYSDATLPGGNATWAKQQVDYMALVTAAGVPGPTKFGQDTSSIMSTGRDFLPRHYVTFWEALGRMTTPDITQAEWKIK